MTILLFLIFILIFYHAKPLTFNEDYTSKYSSTCIKGIFLLFVFLSHFSSYQGEFNHLDQIFLTFNRWFGQLMVTMFLFFSGYGIMVSINKKGRDYVNSIPFKRIFLVWMHFVLALILFWIIQTSRGIYFSPKTVILSVVAWDSLGNSNWYVFDILFAYFITFISFKLNNMHTLKSILTITAFSILFVIIMSFKKDSWWYNTFLCYTLGIWYAYYKKPIDNFLRNDTTHFRFAFCVILLLNLFFINFHLRGNLLIYTFLTFTFVSLILLLTIKVSIGNPILYWLGKHLFSLYILQRIPMILMKSSTFITEHLFLYFVLSFISTLILASLFDFIVKFIDIFLTKIISRKKV